MAGKHSYSYDEELPKAMQRNYQRTSGSGRKSSKNKKGKKKGLKLKAFAIIFIVLMIILVSIVGAAYWYVNDKLAKMQQVDIDEEQLGISDDISETLSKYRHFWCR